MKSKLTSFEYTIIVGFVLIALAGGAGLYWISGELDASNERLKEKTENLKKLVLRRYLPGPKNAEILKSNIQIMDETLVALQPKLTNRDTKLAKVKSQDMVTIKKEFENLRTDLVAFARKKAITVPPNYNFAFSKYLEHKRSPDEKWTLMLGKQLVAIEYLVNTLFESSISKLEAVHRTLDEDGPDSGAKKDLWSGDGIPKASIVEDPQQLFTEYPFELVFVATPGSFRAFVNKLVSSDYVWIIRSCQVNSLRMHSPNLDELNKSAPTAEAAATGDETVARPKRVAKEVPHFVLGDETVRVSMRLVLVEWHGLTASQDDSTKEKTDKKKNKPKES